MCGSISGWARRWWGSEQRPWPILGCPSGSFVSWSGTMAEVIVALDLPGGSDAIRLLDRLPDARWVKVGSILMTREGPDLIREITYRESWVFLDLKWHDFPNTVLAVVGTARELSVSQAMLSMLYGDEMMRGAARSV